jgi:glucose/arabinose dehydrogenase
MRSLLFLLIPTGIISSFIGHFGPTEQLDPTTPSHFTETALNADGGEVYAQYCASCHGADGRDFIQRSWKLGSRAEDLKRVIANGSSLLGMPAFGEVLSQDDIKNVSDYLLQKAAEAPSFFAAPPKIVRTTDISLRANIIIDGLDTPWGMDFLNDTVLIFTEREGRLWAFHSGIQQEILGLPKDIHVKGQGGLLDVMLWTDPASDEDWIYLTYSKDYPTDKKLSATAAVRSQLKQSAQGFTIGEWEEILVAGPYSRTHHHYGSRMAMGADNMLYITCGERGMRNVHPQNLSTSPGKVHRLHPNGAVPEDNPFVNVDGAVPSIWSWGHRNPQGMFVHPTTNEVWTHEHGPKGGDEINVLRKGANYGWPEITFGRNYTGTIITRDTAKAGMEQPLHYWLPSIGACGMDVIQGASWPKSWQNNLLVGSLSFEYLERVVLDASGKVSAREKLLDGVGRVRDIARSDDGTIYVAVEGAGMIFQLEPILED